MNGSPSSKATAPHFAPHPSPPLWQAILLTAMAGGMGWGIRGQYGHETGAMIAGALISLVLARLFCPTAAPLPTARAVAFGTIAIGFGGSMTYGQTIGLTQNAPLIGNWAALEWGMLGLAIKGAIWFGFAGVFLGMGLGGVHYRPKELLLLMAALLVLFVAGIWLLNMPFDPARKILPQIYFSADWRWQPGADLKPRREVWGGLLCALIGATVYSGWLRRDSLAVQLGMWGMIGGAVGFPLGQSLQAFHAWNPALFRASPWASVDTVVNWWNMMETTFGATAGAALGLGLWLNRRRVAPLSSAADISIQPAAEWTLATVHAAFLIASDFLAVPWVSSIYEYGLVMGVIPLVAVAGGRWWPFLLPLPVTMLPIAGKTFEQLVWKEALMSPVPGFLMYAALPLVLTMVAAIRFSRASEACPAPSSFLRPALLLTTWLYFGLNFAFFHFPWPWTTWTARTPNAVIFAVCALGLTALAAHEPIRSRRR